MQVGIRYADSIPNRRLVGGQATLEFGILMAAVVAALAVLTVYVQNCVRGSFVQAAQSHGQQFSPQSYSENRKLTLNQLLSQHTGREWIKVVYPPDAGGAENKLPPQNLPYAVGGAGRFWQRSQGTTNWSGTRNATYKSQ